MSRRQTLGWRQVQADREEIRHLGIDLYPPGAEPDTAAQEGQTDE